MLFIHKTDLKAFIKLTTTSRIITMHIYMSSGVCFVGEIFV